MTVVTTEAPEGPAELEELARFAYATGDLDGALDAYERLHVLQLAAGDTGEAARAASLLALHLLIDSGLMSSVRGWTSRAERLVADLPEHPVHAMVAMIRAYERFFSGDVVSAAPLAARAVELGTRLGVPPAVVVGRTAQARLTITAGRVEEGLALLEELAVDLSSPDLDPMAAGMMLCEIVCCAQSLGRLDLAREWTELFDRWRQDQAFGGLHGRCRVHRAELLRASGPLEEAEQEALAACEELRPWLRRELGWPLAELGTIRLQRGDLVGAEEALQAAHAHAWCPQPALARVRLAQGRVEEAIDMILDAVAHPLPMPSKEQPPFGDLRVAPLLDGLAEVAMAAGRPELVRQSADRLNDIACRFGGPGLTALATVAGTRALLAAGEPAVDRARAAVAATADAGSRFEEAVARDLLAFALEAVGDAHGAAAERAVARAGFAAVRGTPAAAEPGQAGAAGVVAAVAAEARGTVRGRWVRDGDLRWVGLDGDVVPVPDLKGLRHIAVLLAAGGREVHVLDLVSIEAGEGAVVEEPGLVAIDEAARAAYRRRLAEVESDLEEARADHDLAREELAARDRGFLLSELGSAVGLHGRLRERGGSTEKARTAVTRSIRYSLARLREHHPALAAHLDATVVTGVWCRYRPDPLVRVDWEVGD